MQITTVVTAMRGLYDEDHPPVVYSGHLTAEQIDAVAREFGWIDRFAGGYADYAILVAGDAAGFCEWLVEYANEPDTPRCPEGGFSEENAAHMKLHIRHGLTEEPKDDD